MLTINENNYCKWRLTPWDSKVFNFATAEIQDIKYSIDTLPKLFELIDQNNLKNQIKLAFFRHDSNDIYLKGIANDYGFQIAEFSIYTKHNDITKIPKGRLTLDFQRAKLSDVPAIKRIASESFEHGRFHEDSKIDRLLAQKRYENWIDDLIETTDFYIFYLKDQVGGFFNYKIIDGTIDMPLSGLSVDAQRLGGFLWVNMFHFIYEQEGIKRISNLISGSNLNVLNLYSRLGFSFSNPLFGYHKYYN